MRSPAAKRWLSIALIILAYLVLSSGSDWNADASTVKTTEDQRSVIALVGPIAFFAGESRSSDGPTLRSWSAEESLEGGGTNRVSGALGAGGLTVGRRRIVVDTAGYLLTCTPTSLTKRVEESENVSLKTVSYDGSPTEFGSQKRKWITIGSLDCTLNTPDGRLLTGSGTYSKNSARTKNDAGSVP